LSLKGIVFLIIMASGAILNMFSKKLAEKAGGSENALLKIKLLALFLVVGGVSLLMIFGK